MATNPAMLTADDVLDLPPPDGAIGWELVDGRPVPVMPASPIHGELIVEVAYRLRRYVGDAAIPGRIWSDAGFVLGLRRDPERMRGPDVAYLGSDRTEAIDPERLFRGVPDLAVEIDLSSGRKPGGQQRVVDYLEAGVRLVWVIDPRSRTAVAYRPDGTARLVRAEGVLEGEDVIPGFRLPLPELFAGVVGAVDSAAESG
jgi:Uma2 family endonuclease